MRIAPLRPFHFHRIAVLALLALLSSAQAFASDPPHATLPAWEDLSPAQRDQLIAPVRERWNAEPAQRARMLQHAKRWRQMTPDQRQHARHGLKRWEHLNPQQRAQMRALFERSRGLPQQQRDELKKRWRQMTPEQRRAWVQAHPPKARQPHPPADETPR